LSSGKKISPEELENKIVSLPGVLEALVTGDGESREIRAEIYASVGEMSVKRSVSALNATLPVYQRIDRIILRNTPFPRTASGKIKVDEA
jgi:long-chain acyl-CoA synthetase